MRSLDVATQSDMPPLCVDLDGTLVRTDMLLETALERLRSNPLDILAWPARLLRGRASFKEQLASASAIDPTFLPYDERVLAYLRSERQRGRRLLLVTASHRSIAERIARHLGLFHEVIATEQGRNLKGKAKAAALTHRFGERGFDYLGDDGSDLPVWRAARAAGTANASRSIVSALKRERRLDLEFAREGSVAVSFVRSLRLHQWIKNALVFVPAGAAHVLGRPEVLQATVALFLAFGLTASGAYLINDLLDLENDRRHPRNKLRPFASGALSLAAGAIAPLLIAVGIAIAAAVAAPAAWILICYAALALGYSLFLKRWPLVDVFTLATLYLARVFAGGVVAGVVVSNWLLTFSGFLFLSLGLIKRCAELQDMSAAASGNPGRGYMVQDLQMLKMIGVASTCMAAIVLALYVDSGAAREHYRLPALLWVLVPLCLFWQWRLWLATNRGYMHHDPVVYALRDWVSWLVALVGLALMVTATTGLVPQ
jgi:4-hydroxybenzoate polyprenyltransferase/phosphoserine phosphatase